MRTPSSSIALLDQLLDADAAFLVIDSNWTIAQLSSKASGFAESEVRVGQDVRQAFPELIGIDALLESGQSRFELRAIQRSSALDPQYFDLKIFTFSEAPTFGQQWMIVLTNVTQAMRLEQSLAQRVNESDLLFSQLNAAGLALTIAELKTYIDRIITSMPDALIVTTAKGTIKTVNSATQQLLEYTESELVNQSIDIVLRTLQNADLEQASLRELETTCQTKTGRTVPVAFSCAKVGTAIADFDGFIYSLRDITERKQAELAKRTFFAMISHEIRTPMNAVLGMTQLLLDSQLSAQQRDLLETIQTSGDALLTVINDILDYSKIESGNLELEQQPFSVQQCVKDAIELLHCKAAEKNLTADFDQPNRQRD